MARHGDGPAMVPRVAFEWWCVVDGMQVVGKTWLDDGIDAAYNCDHVAVAVVAMVLMRPK